MDQQFKDALSKVNNRKLDRSRQQPNLKIMEAVGNDDDAAPELFVANPSDDIPRNKLTEQLTRGLQAYVQRMQKRESFYAELTIMTH